jgi:hypothetical protein
VSVRERERAREREHSYLCVEISQRIIAMGHYLSMSIITAEKSSFDFQPHHPSPL